MSKKNDQLLEEMREQFREAELAERTMRAESTHDLDYIAGNQWDPVDKKGREESGRPCLVMNKLPNFVQQVVAQQRQNRPGAKVSPVSDGADKDTADVLQGIIRHIEYVSRADTAYDTAFEYSVSCGFGAFRFTTEYLPGSFDQELKLQRIPDPFAVYWDPSCKEVDYSDAKWAFVIETITRDEFKRRWPKSELVGFSFFENQVNPAPEWIRADRKIQIAEYWRIEMKERTLQLLSDGRTVYADETQELPRGVTVEDERTEECPQVFQHFTNGIEFLDETEWLGKYIPIVPVLGKELIVSGKRNLFSLIRFARDPQQLYNYYRSAEAEAVGTAPKSPFVGVLGQFRTKQEQWEKANVVNYAYLEVDPVSVGGQPAPLPQRQSVEPAIQALSMGAMQASDDIKATTGIFDPSLGVTKPDLSGKAVGLLQQQGDQANFHLIDNFTRAVTHGYRIMLDLIPKLYKTGREVRILGMEDKERIIKVNQQFQDEGGPKLYKLDVGRYDVTVDVGPSYKSKRAEAAADMAEFAKAVPELVPQYADLYVKAQDWPMADEIAERVCPPQFASKPGADGKPTPPLPPQVQAMAAQHSQLVNQVHQLSQVIEQKQIEEKGKFDREMTKLNLQYRIEQLKADTTLRAAELQAKNSTYMAEVDARVQSIETALGYQAKANLQMHSQAHDAAMASMEHQHSMAQQEMDHQHSMAQQESAQQAQADQQQAAAIQDQAEGGADGEPS